jgi:hypothetical protein
MGKTDLNEEFVEEVLIDLRRHVAHEHGAAPLVVHLFHSALQQNAPKRSTTQRDKREYKSARGNFSSSQSRLKRKK